MDSTIHFSEKNKLNNSKNNVKKIKLNKGKVKVFFPNIFKNILKLFCVYPFFYES